MGRELERCTRERLERVLLPQFLPQQRWFGGKGRRIADVQIADVGRLEVGLRLLLAKVHYHDEEAPDETYVLALRWGETGEPLVEPLTLHIHSALLNLIESRGSVKLHHGSLRAFATSELQPISEGACVRRFDGEQSNTSFQVGNRYILKLIRRLEPGANPELEVSRFLTERTSVRRAPALAGWVEYHRPGQEPATLALLHEYVANEGSAWEHALHSLASGFGASLPRTRRPTLEVEGSMMGRVLGIATGELHLALAADASHPDFRPEPLGEEDLKHVQRRIHEHLEVDLPQVERAARGDDSPWRELAKSLLDRRAELVARARLPRVYPGTTRIRCHGDYHLGQVLWSQSNCWIIDFEGEPTRPLAERRLKQSPLKDVAGMLRSFDYAAHAAVRGLENVDAKTRREAEELARTWRNAAQTSFLDEYRNACRGASFIPPGPHFEETLNFFLLDKALYELHYELNNRPDWVGIPLAGILELLHGPASGG